MSDGISLLPEEQRKKEDELTQGRPVAAKPSSSEIKFSVPVEEGEDVEVIEIDEGEVDQVLAGEPSLTRFVYKVASLFDELKTKLFQPKELEPPPKLPPQFFTPPPLKPKPMPRPATVAGTAATPAPVMATPAQALSAAPLQAEAAPARPKAKITPFESVPRRVRVIKRIRKPVRVSFVSEEDLRLLRIDVPKRRFTFIVAVIFFLLLLGGGYYFLNTQAQAADGELAKADQQLADVRSQIQQGQSQWITFQDLQPRLKALGTLLDQHISPTRLFDDLEKNTLPTVSYESFSLSPDKRVTLLTSADSFATAAQQIAVFQRLPFITKVEATGYSAKYEPPEAPNPKSVEFQVVLTLSSNALTANATVANAAP